MKKDDSTISERQRAKVSKRADLLLRKAGAYGVFPTPIDNLVSAAELEISREVSLDGTFLGSLYSKLPNRMKTAPEVAKRAIDKVLGVLHRPERLIILDQTVHPKKQTFLTIHEVGHDFLPWQKSTFQILEDSRSELDPETSDLFEREANCFSSDIIFQLDRFQQEAADSAFCIQTPVDLAKRYGSSVYAAMRRYVHTSSVPCYLAIFNKPQYIVGEGYSLSLRRTIPSPDFSVQFGTIRLPNEHGPDSFFSKNVPSRGFGTTVECRLNNANDEKEDCHVEVFNSSWQVFFLIYPKPVMSRRIVLAG